MLHIYKNIQYIFLCATRQGLWWMQDVAPKVRFWTLDAPAYFTTAAKEFLMN